MNTLTTDFPLKADCAQTNINNWWAAFKENESKLNEAFSPEFDREIDWAVEFMQTHLGAISPDLHWEFGPGQDKSHVLVFAPERNRAIEPLARLVMASAPNLTYFEFQLNRGATNWGSMQAICDTRMDWAGPDGVMFTLTQGEQNMFDLVFYVPAALKTERVFGNCFLTAESLLGERVFATWIHVFEVEDLPKKGLFARRNKPDNSSMLPLSNLRETLATQIADIKNKLPTKPLYEIDDDGEWALLQMEPEQAEDYIPMGDLYVAPIMSVDIFQATYSGRGRFYSERFSALGEQFIFLQMDGFANDLNMEVFEDRGGIEDALNEALNSEKLGGVIGGGTGLRYSYIFLAVLDLEKSVPLIRKALQAGKLTRRSWLFFNDTLREQEWIGIWDDTPAPKLPDPKR